MANDYDVIVIGAGFAGITAARECSHRGLSALILEGRDRIGGRTFTTKFSNGEPIDLGGTYVHWTEPHMWAEITRYDLEDELVDGGGDAITHVATPDAAGNLKWYSAQEHYFREKGLFEEFFKPSTRLFPKPFNPLLKKDELANFDISLAERIKQLKFSADDEAYFRAFLTYDSGGDLDKAGYLALMRWWVLGGHDYDGMHGVLLAHRFKGGTVTLLNAILQDSNTEVKLGTPVTAIQQDADAVRITTKDGQNHTAAACVVATPSGCWGDIEFSPSLSDARLRVSRERSLQAQRGASTKAVIQGETREFSITTPLGHPLGYLYTLRKRSDDVQVVEVDEASPMQDATDTEQMTAAIKDLLPHVEVLELVTETYHQDNRFARGAWPMYHAGVLTAEEPPVRLSEPEGRLVFATADIAHFWNSFMDGAIESGIRAGRHVCSIVAQPS
jgi:monoamine oxidase